jgi:hypothetical protein
MTTLQLAKAESPIDFETTIDHKITRILSTINADTMGDLFNAISNYVTTTFGFRTGKNLMANGDVVKLEPMTYQCHKPTASDCAYSDQMLSMQNRYGSIECADDLTGCILDAESSRRVLIVRGTSSSKLTLRALTFQNGQASTNGGGLYLQDNAIVDLLLCVFSGCRAGNYGGGIYVRGTMKIC